MFTKQGERQVMEQVTEDLPEHVTRTTNLGSRRKSRKTLPSQAYKVNEARKAYEFGETANTRETYQSRENKYTGCEITFPTKPTGLPKPKESQEKTKLARSTGLTA